MGALFWIGIALFVIGTVMRLVFAVKIRHQRNPTLTMQEFDDRTKPYRKGFYLFMAIALVGLTIAIFSI